MYYDKGYSIKILILQTLLNNLSVTTEANKVIRNYFSYVISTRLRQIPEPQELQTMDLLIEILGRENLIVFL